jgi:hypothetical protein
MHSEVDVNGRIGMDREVSMQRPINDVTCAKFINVRTPAFVSLAILLFIVVLATPEMCVQGIAPCTGDGCTNAPPPTLPNLTGTWQGSDAESITCNSREVFSGGRA